MSAAQLATRGQSLTERWDAFERRRAFSQQRVAFLTDLGEMMQEGKGSINQVLNASARRTPNAVLSAAFRDVRDRVNGGMLLHLALQPYFRPMENMLIEAVSVNSKTDAERGEGFVTAARMIENLGSTGAGVARVLVDLFMTLLSVGFMWLGVAHFAAEQFAQIAPRRYWPELSRIVIGIGDSLVDVWPVTLGVIVAAVVAIAWALPNWIGTRRRWADQRLPGFRLYRLVRSTPIMMALGTFLAARIGFDRAIKNLLQRANRWEAMYLEEMLANFQARHERGVDIVDVGMFDWQAMVRVEVRSMGVDIDEALRYVAVEAGPRLAALINTRTKQASAGIKGVQRVLLLLVAAAIGFVYLAVVQNAGRSF